MNQNIVKYTYRIAAALLLAAFFTFAFVSNRSTVSGQSQKDERNEPEVVTVKAEKRGFPLLNLQDGKKFETRFGGGEAIQGQPLTMTNADLNADGAADLVVGYADGNLAVYRGSLDTLSARTPEIFEGMKQGRFPAPFLSDATLIKVPVAPDFIGTGDFNRDGAMDILAAARNDSNIYLLAGNGGSEFKQQRLEIPGQITAMLTGNIDPLDNAADVAVGIYGTNGAELLVYSGAENAFGESPAVYPLPSAATSLAIGQLDDDVPMDILVGAGFQIAVVHGSYQKTNNSNRVEIINQGFDIGAVRVGNFVWDRDYQPEIALLDTKGTVHILERDGLNKIPYSEAEGKQLWKIRREQMLAQEAAHGQNVEVQKQTLRRRIWSETDSFLNITAPFDKASAASPAFFTSIRMTTEPVDDLIILDSASRKMQILVKANNELKQSGEVLNYSTSGTRAAISFDVEGTPAAVLPMRLSVMTSPGIVLLNKESADISYLIAAPAATFNVTKTADTYDGACNADCSLREALQAANATMAADIIMVPAGTYTTTIGPADDDFANDPAAQQSGDFDVFFDLTMTGAGQDSTIIQAGTTAPGLDRVLDAIQAAVGVPNLSISGVTLQNGRCAAGTCGDGGGLRYGVDAASQLTISDTTITDNRTDVNTANPANNGGGIFGGQSKFVFTNVTVTNNTTAFVTGGCATGCGGEGGGIFAGVSFTPNPTSVIMTNCTVTGNTANSPDGTTGGRGGGYAGSPNSVTITNGTFSNNIAFNDAGGLRLFTPTTISGATISGNSAKKNGGGIMSDPLANDNTPLTNTFTNLTMKGNTADSDGLIVGGSNRGDGGAIYHGRGTLNLSGSTIGGTGGGEANTAFNGGGIGRTYSIATMATFNASTLNINGGSIVGNLAINNGGGVINDATRTANNAASALNIGVTTAVTVTNNNAQNNGGGIAVITGGGSPSPAAAATLNNMVIRNNTANSDSIGGGDGGGLFQDSGGVSGGGTTFTGTLSIGGSGFANSAVNGGGISNANGTLTLPANTDISFNTATGNGGGIFNGGTINSFSGATINSNSATTSGGGIFNSGTITVSGATINSNSAATGSSVTQNAGTFNSVGTNTLGNNLAITGGTFDAGSSTVNLGGNFVYTGGTFTEGTSTFNFNGTTAQSINAVGTPTFNNLTDSNTTQPLTVNNSINVNGTLSVNGANAILAPVASTIIGGTGTLTGTGTARVTRATGTNDFFGQYTITNKTLTNLTVEYAGGSTQGVSGTTYSDLRINNASGANLSANATVDGTLFLTTGIFNVQTNTLTINSGTTVGTGSLASAATGTVNYNQGSNGQVILSGDYGNLTFSNFNKDLTNATIGVAGTFTPGSGTATTTGSTFTFNGAAAQTIPVFNYNNLTLNNAAGASLGGNVTVGGGLTLTAGNLAVDTNTLTLNGAATSSGGTFSSAATGTVNYNQGSDGQSVLAGNYGNLTFSNFNKTLPSGTVAIAGTFTPGSAVGHTVTGNTINFNGAAAQTIPVFNYNNLMLDNTTGATLAGNTSVPGALTLTNGILNTDANILTIDGTGTTARTNGYVASSAGGGLQKIYNAASSFTFPIGTANGYSPAIVNVTAGTFPLDFTLRAVQSPQPNLEPAISLQRYWVVTPSAGSNPTGDLTFNYLDTDVMGVENNYLLARVSNGTPFVYAPSDFVLDTVNNTVTITGTSVFSDWTLTNAAPTAASVNVGGRISDNAGNGIANAIVSMTDETGSVITMRGNSFGYYNFDDVEVGRTYILNVTHRRYQFSPQVVFVNDERNDLNFVVSP